MTAEIDVVSTVPDSQALKVLVDNHSQFIRYLSSRVGSEEVAEDLLQQGLLRATEQGGRLEDHTNVVAWFYTVLKNLLIDHYRGANSADRKHERFITELTATGEDHVVVSATELGREICACMNRLIPLLRPQYGEVIRRIDLEGAPHEVVARDLGVSVGNLTVRLHRARQALKKSLELSCGTCTKHGCLDCTCK